MDSHVLITDCGAQELRASPSLISVVVPVLILEHTFFYCLQQRP